ncbi:MAG: hypothetical protein IJJ28_02285 [Lentisphaeria bacterium]|nr:hypothetical protein [Lentisphaeria bacterium]
MKKSLFAGVLAAAGVCLAGCASTEIYDDPEKQPDDIRSEYTISSAELRKAAQAAIEEALTDEDFNEFVAAYKAKNQTRPLMKLDAVRNDSDDPDLNVSELNGFIENQLRKSKKVRITRYEGANRIQGIGASRLNQDDENFRQDTVAQTGTIEAAVLIMRPHIISNRVADGRRARVTRTFTVEIVTVNGELIMKSDKQLGFSRTRGVVGW